MSDVDQDQKTEQATDKHKSEAHARGQFAKAPEVGIVLMLIGALGVFSMTMGTASHEIGAYATGVFAQIGSTRATMDLLPSQLIEGGIVIAKVFGPILGVCVLAALIAGGLQSGFHFTPEVLGFKFEKLNPAEGLQRVFSKQSWVHGGVDLLKLFAIGLVLWGAAETLIDDPIFSAPVEAEYLGMFMNRSTLAFLARLILALGIVAAASYWYEFLRSKKDLMMSRQEVKDESKQSEGDALVKGAMKRMARRLLQKQMLAAVPTADVIITNPTHYAVALKYERGVDQAPVILAKGENRFALRIKALAAQHGVPTVENRPVARMLYALGRVDEAIPPQLYQAVAEILAFVYRTHRYYFYRLKTRRSESGKTKPAVRVA